MKTTKITTNFSAFTNVSAIASISLWDERKMRQTLHFEHSMIQIQFVFIDELCNFNKTTVLK